MGSCSPSPLQAPFTSPALTLTHRVVLAPMTRMRASNTTGLINPTAATYYAERTSQPGALLISEGVTIHPRGKGFPRTPGLWTDGHARAWQPITAAVHARGGTFFAQLWHVGRVSVPRLFHGQPPLSSTTAHLPGYHVSFGAGGPDEAEREAYVPSHAMTIPEIHEVVAQFAAAARRAIAVAGFDGVEIHAANGYLLDCFVHDNINTRGDEYGGPAVSNRLRFPLAVVDAVVDAVGARRTAVRLAPFHVLQGTGDGDRVATFGAFAAALEARGLAYVHFVEPRYDLGSSEGAFSGCIAREKRVDEGGEERSIWPFRRILQTTPVIGAGGYDAVSAAQAIEEGRIDLAAFGRYFTSNPDLPERLFRGLPLTKYHRPTFYTSGEEGYLGWPQWSEK
ncbi:putative NADPH dehydrogenase [Aspergillus aculeatinus CBS 121060]|uniref:NADPH dehydrogenase n=1 Tax=Aspergillus aculeatinus CBS 121060 TaxID=1448322 RepID=A0ACD1HPY7_9EURO|nr:putative NADPH dehydrogenase [Aspergillus aculeatinus CBS 121060]RAH75462.1 putative NADPH dehydrogenase [Aspergillus aculeatinus CBS 121060]